MLGFGASMLLHPTRESLVFNGFCFALSLFVYLIPGHGAIYPRLLPDFLAEECEKSWRKWTTRWTQSH